MSRQPITHHLPAAMPIAVEASGGEVAYAIFPTIHLRLLVLDGRNGFAIIGERPPAIAAAAVLLLDKSANKSFFVPAIH